MHPTLKAIPLCLLAASACSSSSPSRVHRLAEDEQALPPDEEIVACLGASTTEGVGARMPFPAVIDRMLGAGWDVRNYGVRGSTTSDLLTRWRSPVRADRSKWLVLQGGLNDLTTYRTPAESVNNLAIITQEAVADGTQVVILTAWPFKGWSTWTTTAETKRQEFNARLLAFCAEGWAACVDTAEIFTSATDPERLAPEFDSGDHLHLNQSGADRIASEVYARFGF